MCESLMYNFVYRSMYNVHCTIHTVRCTMYSCNTGIACILICIYIHLYIGVNIQTHTHTYIYILCIWRFVQRSTIQHQLLNTIVLRLLITLILEITDIRNIDYFYLSISIDRILISHYRGFRMKIYPLLDFFKDDIIYLANLQWRIGCIVL